jgi:microcystin-dependent protein
MEAFIGQITLFAGNFAPRGWAFCQGQLLSIAQNTALYSILGTTYGGDGRTTFALPDLQGRSPIQQGQGAGLSNYVLGQQGGNETVTLQNSQMPAHNHSLNVNNTSGTTGNPTNAYPGFAVNSETGSEFPVYDAAAPNGTMNAGVIGLNGGSEPHENRPPYLALNYIICLEGIYPSRN